MSWEDNLAAEYLFESMLKTLGPIPRTQKY